MIARSLLALTATGWLVCHSPSASTTAPPFRADSPVTILLVIDGSARTIQCSFSFGYVDARSRLARVIEREFINRLDPNDRLRIGSFGTRLTLSDAYTTDRKASAGAVRAGLTLSKEDLSGPSPIWDVVGQALSELTHEPGRRAVVLMTDGEATANTRTSTEVGLEAAVASIPIHIVSTAIDTMIPQGSGTFFHARPSVKLRELADVSGGLFLAPPEADREYRPYLSYESFDSYLASRTHVTPPAWDPDPGKAFATIAARLHAPTAATSSSAR